MNGCIPVYRNSNESEDGRSNSDVGHEVVDGAIERAKGPVRVEHEDEVEDAVEQCHHQVRHTEVHEEVVGYSPHPTVS